jgi:3',5'-cyclic AMP phosphodiesterase CpdA
VFLLAHLSDPHLGPVPLPRLRELTSKRVLGYTNWRVRRRRRHDMSALQILLTDLVGQSPDHIAVTGDLAVVGLAAEFLPARGFLESLGPADRVSVVPGNHDAYVRATAQHAQMHWSDYMRGDGEPDAGAPHFPYVRRRGAVALIGLSTAVPTAPLSANGLIGPSQAKLFADLLEKLGGEGAFRVVLIHHPPTPGGDYLRRLHDAWRVADAIRAHGAELVLHGHNHRLERGSLAGPDGAVPVIGVPSASAGPNDRNAPGGYNLYAIDGSPGRWRCEAVTRGFARAEQGVAERARALLLG